MSDRNFIVIDVLLGPSVLINFVANWIGEEKTLLLGVIVLIACENLHVIVGFVGLRDEFVVVTLLSLGFDQIFEEFNTISFELEEPVLLLIVWFHG